MTKLDGDARGGAALSIKEITGRPIKFLGMGEKLDALEEFRPEGLASRILGMGDVVGLVKDFEDVVDQDKAEEDAMRMLQGRFTLEDFLDQLKTIKKMGSVQSLLDKLPGMGDLMPEGAQVDSKQLTRIEAMILSMTPAERERPELLEQRSRQERIARGSGRKIPEINRLLKQFAQMKRMMKTVQSAAKKGRKPNLPFFGR